MEQLNKEIQEAITKNLPAQVGEALQQLLAKATKDAQELADAKRYIEQHGKLSENLSNSVAELQTQLERHANIDDRLRELDEAKRDRKIFELETKLAAEQRVTHILDQTLSKLVRNIEYRNTLFGKENIPITGHNAPSWVAVQDVNRTSTTSGE